MADNSANIYPYPLQFDPSQWANPYTAYNKMALPFMGAMGQNPSNAPTDAHGNPIASYGQAAAAQAAAPPMAPAKTLNSSPSASSNPMLQQLAGWTALQGGAAGQGTGDPYLNAIMGQGQGTGGQAAPPQQQAAAAPSGTQAMNAAYLAALQNPGKVNTPGATVPMAQTPTGQSGVLQQFLNNWQQGGGNTKGAGNYNNQGFFNALQGQV